MSTRFVHRGTELEALFPQEYDDDNLAKWVSGVVTKIEERFKTYVRAHVKFNTGDANEDSIPVDLWNYDFNNKDGVTPWRFRDDVHTETVENLLHVVDDINNRLKDILNLYDKMVTPYRLATDSDDDSSIVDKTEEEDSSLESTPFSTDTEHEYAPTQESMITAPVKIKEVDDSIFQPINILVAMTAVLLGLRMYELVCGVKV
jgi:hypothetical protein